MFSLSVSSLFFILKVCLWCPGDSVNYEGKHYLLNVTCYITHFVVTVTIAECAFTIITHYFMQDVFIKFGLCHLVVIDNSTLFKCVFTTMCDRL